MFKDVVFSFKWNLLHNIFYSRNGTVGHYKRDSFNKEKEGMETNWFRFPFSGRNRINRNQFGNIVGSVSDLKVLTVRKKKGDIDGICVMYDRKTKCCIRYCESNWCQ